MKIDKINIKNFYSFKNTTLELGDYSGLTLIKGKNKDTGGSNGSGKSALVEAIYFGLTGKTIRKSTEDSLVNNQAKKKCVVEMHLTHNEEYVVITRQKKPTKLEFTVGGDIRTKATVAATQAEIDSFLNINHKVLLASMFFGQSNDINFLDCSAEDKRTIIRNFLNLDDLFHMRDKIKNHKSSFYQGTKKNDAIINENLKNISKLDTKILQIEEAKEEFSSYDDYTLSLSLEDILEGEKRNQEVTSNINSLCRDRSHADKELGRINKLLKNPKTIQECHWCKQKIKREVNTEELDKELSRWEITKKDLDRDISKLKLFLWDTPITSTEFVKVLKYKDLCRDETNYSELREDFTQAVADAQSEKDKDKTWYEVMRFWEKAFSEQGVIKHIINNILEYFNEQCNYYLSYLTNSNYFVEFDRELNEKIETDGKLVQYISLSGGEKRKINLAIMLGLKDLLILTDKSHVDLLFFDEVAENIDEAGIHGLYQLLLEIKKNKTVFVITHNKYLKTLLDSSPRLSIIKHKGISKIKT